MNRIATTFNRLKQQRRRALVGYLTAGDPDFTASFGILRAAVAAGLDVLELGVPFSDPTADGPVIQEASARALRSGMTLARVLELAQQVRAGTHVPIVLFSYFNPLLAYGLKRLVTDAAAAGVDGFLVVDLPPEEADDLRGAIGERDLPLIRLVAPTTRPDRLRSLTQDAGGFLYLITRTGVTGTGGLDFESVRNHAASVKALSSLPVCLGFGISSPEDVRTLGRLADGVVVGSALVRIAAEHGADGSAADRISTKVRELRKALDENP